MITEMAILVHGEFIYRYENDYTC